MDYCYSDAWLDYLGFFKKNLVLSVTFLSEQQNTWASYLPINVTFCVNVFILI